MDDTDKHLTEGPQSPALSSAPISMNSKGNFLMGAEVNVRPVDPCQVFEVFKGKDEFSCADVSHQPGFFLRKALDRTEFQLDLKSNHLTAARMSGKGCLQGFSSPLDVVVRLQNEVNEIQEFLQTYTENGEKSSETSVRDLGADPQLLLGELHIMQKQLTRLLENESVRNVLYGPEHQETSQMTTLSTSSERLTEILSNINKAVVSSQNTTTVDGDPQSANEKTGDHFQKNKGFEYELYALPSLQPFIDSGRLAKLEARLAHAEELVGVQYWQELSFPFNSLCEGIEALFQRLSNLEPSKVEVVSRDIQKLNGEIENILHRKAELVGSKDSDSHRILETFELCEKWRSASSVLPVVIKRLQLLKKLHQEAASASCRLITLEKQQAELSRLLESTACRLQEFKQTVVDNISWASTMMTDLQTSLKELKTNTASPVKE